MYVIKKLPYLIVIGINNYGPGGHFSFYSSTIKDKIQRQNV